MKNVPSDIVQSVVVPPKNKISITVIGDHNVGKTSLLNSLIFENNNENEKQAKTTGIDRRYWRMNNDTLIKFYEVGHFDAIHNEDTFINLSNFSLIIFLVVDCSSPSSAQSLVYYEKYFPNNKIVLVFNKDDRPKMINENSENIKRLKEMYKIDKTFLTCAFNKESMESFKSDITNYIEQYIKEVPIDELAKKESLFNSNPELKFDQAENKKKTIGCF